MAKRTVHLDKLDDPGTFPDALLEEAALAIVHEMCRRSDRELGKAIRANLEGWQDVYEARYKKFSEAAKALAEVPKKFVGG